MSTDRVGIRPIVDRQTPVKTLPSLVVGNEAKSIQRNGGSRISQRGRMPCYCFCKIFAKNSMKMEDPLGSATTITFQIPKPG